MEWAKTDSPKINNFLKKLKGQPTHENRQKTNFTEKDIALTHEYEETIVYEGVTSNLPSYAQTK